MSSTHSKFLGELLEEYFGTAVRQTVEPLIQFGPLTLSNISLKSGVPVKIIKKCLTTLIQHNVILFSVRTVYLDTLYSLDSEAVLSIFRFSKYCEIVDLAMGTEAKVVLGTLIRNGEINLSKLIFLLTCQHFLGHPPNAPPEGYEVIAKYFSTFTELAKRKYVIRCDHLVRSGSTEVPEFIPYESGEGFIVPNICVKTICGAVMRKDSKVDDISNEDDEILWKINLPVFDTEMRQDLLVEAMYWRVEDSEATMIFKALLQLGLIRNSFAHTTTPISIPELKIAIKKLSDSKYCLEDFNEYLDILANESLGLVVKTSEINGGLYIVKVKEAFNQVTYSMVEKLVETRFGAMAARIFRLVRRHGFVEQDKLMQMGMMSTKMGRSILYKLVEANFIILKEIRKSYTISSSVTNKVVSYIFHIDFVTLLRSILEDSYQAIVNAKLRLKAEKHKYRRLLVKEDRIDKILFNMTKARCSEEQLDEVRAMLTYPERAILNKVRLSISKLTAAQLHADRTLFLINTYFIFQQS